MTMLLAAAAVFLGIHVLISGTRVRDAITGAIGEGPYMGLFSLASLAAIVWLVIAFNHANGSVDDKALYSLGVGVKHLAIPVVALAFFLGVQGLLAPNPTSIRQEGAIAKEGTIHGVVRITRHPFLWGVALWAAFHVVANGNLASVIFFGTFLVLSIVGTLLDRCEAQTQARRGLDGIREQDVEHPLRRGVARQSVAPRRKLRLAFRRGDAGVPGRAVQPCASVPRVAVPQRLGAVLTTIIDLIFTALAGR